MKNSILVKTVLIAASLPLLAGCIVERQPRRVVVVQQPAATEEVIVEQPSEPPTPQYEIVPAPRPGFLWIRGGWEWRGRWVWLGGHWEHPHPGHAWAGGHWESRGHGSVWISAGWR
jgi:hypothetical protein